MDVYKTICIVGIVWSTYIFCGFDATLIDVACENPNILMTTTGQRMKKAFGHEYAFVGFFVNNADPKTKCNSSPAGIFNLWSSPNEIDPVNADFAYEDCGVKITEYYGGNHELLQYGVYIDGRLRGMKNLTLIDPSSLNISVPIDCRWNAHAVVTATAHVSTEPTKAPPSGNTTLADKELSLALTDPKTNKSLDNAHLSEGDLIRVNILLKKESIYYLSELPLSCSVTPVQPRGASITAVSRGCPYADTMKYSPFHFSAFKSNDHDYYFDFSAFTVDGSHTQLKIECDIRACIQLQDCNQTCWNNSNSHSLFFNEEMKSPLMKVQTAMSTKHQHLYVAPTSTTAAPVATTDKDQSTDNQSNPQVIILAGVAIALALASVLGCCLCCLCCACCPWAKTRQHGGRDIYVDVPTVYPLYAPKDQILQIPRPYIHSSNASSHRSITSDPSYGY